MDAATKPLVTSPTPGTGPVPELPEPYKLEVIKFLNTPAGQMFLSVIGARRPAWPGGAETPHGHSFQCGTLAGYEKCLEQILKIPQELQQDEIPPDSRVMEQLARD